MTEPQPKKSELTVRLASAVVMVGVAGTALWLGGWWWTAFLLAVALGVLREWWGLIAEFQISPAIRGVWIVAGIGYLGLAAFVLIGLRTEALSFSILLTLLAAVVATDVGAYFAGRAIGGPKIAPKISPSKTWAGLAGAIIGAGLAVFVGGTWPGLPMEDLPAAFLIGLFIAITAQTGDFFESWMKRRAGVKDSGNLIPGHGGLFDRVDGLLAVLFVLGILNLTSRLSGAS